MINVAIIGAGIGALHLAAYRCLPGKFTVSAMCDMDTARAEMAIERDTGIRIVSDIEEVLSDPSVDLIDVCLPPHLHLSAVLRVLAAEKHAICEKPLARSVAEVSQMAEAMAVSKGRVFPVFQYRFGRSLSQLRALQDTGLTGRPLTASVETHWNRGTDYYDVSWRGTWKGEAGGAVLGHAIHVHDLICHVMGPVSELTAYLDTLVNDIEVDDCAAIAMRLENGALATSSVTLGAATDTTRLRFCYSGLTAESGTAPYTPAEDVWTFTARGPTRQEDVDRVVNAVRDPLPGFTGFLSAVADTLNGNDSNHVSFADGRRSVEMVTAMYISARGGHPVALPIDEGSALYEGWVPD